MRITFLIVSLLYSILSYSQTIQLIDSTQTWFIPQNVKVTYGIELTRPDTTVNINLFKTTFNFDCGQWIPDTTKGDWIPVVDKKTIIDAKTAVYSKIELLSATPITTARYCPCGCPQNIALVQKRIDTITGNIEYQVTNITYTYTPEKDAYGKIEELHNKK